MWKLDQTQYHYLLSRLINRFGKGELQRIEEGLANLVSSQLNALKGSDGQRHCTRFWLPDLPSRPWWHTSEVDVEALLKADINLLIEDYQYAISLGGHPEGYETSQADAKRTLIDPNNDTPLHEGWRAIPLLRDGCWQEMLASQSPHAMMVLDRLPLYPGDSMYSILAPRTEIPAHFGLDNVSLTVHLPLIVPAGCCLEVAGNVREMREGEVLVFDDSYEHRAWNPSSNPRLVFLVDIWHPELSHAEIEALRYLWTELNWANR